MVPVVWSRNGAAGGRSEANQQPAVPKHGTTFHRPTFRYRFIAPRAALSLSIVLVHDGHVRGYGGCADGDTEAFS